MNIVLLFCWFTGIIFAEFSVLEQLQGCWHNSGDDIFMIGASRMEKNLRGFLAEHVLAMSAYWICTGVLVAKLTEYYSLPLSLSNFLTGLSSTLLVLQPIGGIIYPKIKNKRSYLVSLNLFWRISLCLVFLTVLLPSVEGGWLVCVFLISMSAGQQLISPAYNDWHVQAVEGRGNSDFYTSRETLFMLVYTVALASIQAILSITEKSGHLKGGFLVSGGIEITLLAMSCVCMLRLPAPAPIEKEAPNMFSMMASVFKDKLFAGVLWANTMWSFANMFVGGFFSLYAVRVLKVDLMQIMIWSAVGNFMRGMLAPVFSRLAKKIGWKNCLSLMIGIMMLVAVGWYNTSPQNMWWLVPILLAMSAVPNAGLSVGILRMQIATSPAELRSVYFSVLSFMGGLLSVVATFLCSGMVSGIESGKLPLHMNHIFMVGFIFMIIPIILFQKMKQEVH